MTTRTELQMPGTPKPWMNATMRAMLRTPGVRSLLGRLFALITVTGASTGRRYTTPIQYVRDGDDFLVLSQVHRTWWRNLRTRPEVELEVAGRTIAATATIAEGEAAVEPIELVLRANPRNAKFYGVAVDDSGVPDPAGVAALAERSVALRITPT